MGGSPSALWVPLEQQPHLLSAGMDHTLLFSPGADDSLLHCNQINLELFYFPGENVAGLQRGEMEEVH